MKPVRMSGDVTPRRPLCDTDSVGDPSAFERLQLLSSLKTSRSLRSLRLLSGSLLNCFGEGERVRNREVIEAHCELALTYAETIDEDDLI